MMTIFQVSRQKRNFYGRNDGLGGNHFSWKLNGFEDMTWSRVTSIQPLRFGLVRLRVILKSN
jgi:hypothetical protein